MLERARVSPAYRKPHTGLQRGPPLNRGMPCREPARTHTRRIRVRRTRVAVLLVVVAATAVLGYESLASSSSTAVLPVDVLPTVGAAVSSTVWPAYGQAAFVQTGQSQIHVGPNQHPA